jgi:hypothetical protein
MHFGMALHDTTGDCKSEEDAGKEGGMPERSNLFQGWLGGMRGCKCCRRCRHESSWCVALPYDLAVGVSGYTTGIHGVRKSYMENQFICHDLIHPIRYHRDSAAPHFGNPFRVNVRFGRLILKAVARY